MEGERSRQNNKWKGKGERKARKEEIKSVAGKRETRKGKGERKTRKEEIKNVAVKKKKGREG